MRCLNRLVAVLAASVVLVALSGLTLGLAQATAPADPGTPDSPLAPQFSVSVVSESEPNDQTGQFDAFGCGDVATGAIGPVGDRDVWAMTGNAGDLIFAVTDARGSASSTDTVLTVLADVTTTVIITDNDSGAGSGSAVAGIPLPLSGRVYFVVDEDGANSTISRYELHAVVISPTNFAVETGSNDFYTQANSISAAFMTGSVPGGADVVDFFKFTANEGDHIAIILDDDPDRDGNRFDSDVTLLDIDGVTALASGDNNSAFQANATSPITAPANGTYYVRISDGGLSGTDKQYRLVVLVNGRPVAGNPCFAKLRITRVSIIDPPSQIGVFTTTLENIGNVLGPARLTEQYPLGVNVHSCALSVSNGGGSITLFACDTGPNGVGAEYGTDALRPGGSVRVVARVAPLTTTLLTRSPQSQTVPFLGAANFTVTLSNTSQLTVTEMHLYDPLLSDCARTWPFATGLPFNSLPPGQSVSYTCSQPGVAARIQSTLALTIPVLLRDFVAGFMVGPNGELDQKGSAATLLMPAETAFAANTVEVHVLRNWLPVLLR